jgi:enediyne biosynthesis protein E4
LATRSGLRFGFIARGRFATRPIRRGLLRRRPIACGWLVVALFVPGCGRSTSSENTLPSENTKTHSAEHTESPATPPASTASRSARVSRASSVPSKGLFTDISDALGIDNSSEPYPNGTFQTPEITPGGVAVFDYDNDGDLDIYQVRHAAPGSFDTPAPNRLYQQQPDGSFVLVPDAAGLADPGFGHGVAVGDIDNDGDLDVFVTNYGYNVLYVNDGNGRFRDATAEAGLPKEHRWSSSAAFLDYDRDGDLDLYVVRFATFDPSRICQVASGEPEYCGPHVFPGELDALYRNEGDGTFVDVTAEAGIDVPGRGWGITCADFTGDGWVDIYIANDEEPAQLWVNNRDGTFTDQAVVRGVAFNMNGRVEAGMGLAVGDVNGDGLFDLLKTHISSETNTLYLALEPGSYSDATPAAGMAAVDLPYTGWGCAFVDFDHDGDLDLAIVNGRVTRGPVDPRARLGPFWNQFAEPNLLFANDGQGRFSDMTAQSGSFGNDVEVSRGLAIGDLDGDGDLDLVVNNLDNTLRVYRNDAPDGQSHWLSVRAMVGLRDDVGAEVTLVVGDRRMVRLVNPAFSFLSSSDMPAHFGLGSVERIDSVEVLWSDGQRERFSADGVDRTLTLHKGTGQSESAAPQSR